MAGNPNDTLDMIDVSDRYGGGPYARDRDRDDRPRGHFEKRYLERNPGSWHRTTTLMTRRQLQRCFIDIAPMLTELYAGEIVRTAFAEYKWIDATANPAPAPSYNTQAGE